MGNILICIENEFIVFYFIELDVVIKMEFDEIFKVLELDKEFIESFEGNWKINFFLNMLGMQEKEMWVFFEGVFVDGNVVFF